MRLFATSDLHLGHRSNREALVELPSYGDDWLIVAGDVGERPEHLVVALETLTPRFGQVIWTPGNHDLWSPRDADRTRGQSRYEELVDICHRFGVLTPEDDYPEWPGAPGTFIVPMFLLFDYSFRPPDIPVDSAVRWARAAGVGSGDEQMLSPEPWGTIADWCRHRCDETEARLHALPADARTVLVNHWPLRYDLARPPRVPHFSVWSGTTGKLDDVPVEDIRRFERDFLDQLKRDKPEVLDSIASTGALSDDTTRLLENAIESFKRTFTTSSGTPLVVNEAAAEALDEAEVQHATITKVKG